MVLGIGPAPNTKPMKNHVRAWTNVSSPSLPLSMVRPPLLNLKALTEASAPPGAFIWSARLLPLVLRAAESMFVLIPTFVIPCVCRID